jgi:hypothetical protein
MYPIKATKLYISQGNDGYSLDGYAVEYIDGYSVDGYSPDGYAIMDPERHEHQVIIIGLCEAFLARRHASKLRTMCESAEQQFDELSPRMKQRLEEMRNQLSRCDAIAKLMEEHDGYQEGSC